MNTPNQSPSQVKKLIRLPVNQLSVAELAVGLHVLATQYKISLLAVIRKLDMVSGNLASLQKVLNGDTKCEWTEEQDKLLYHNQAILIRWKGKEDVQRRKQYLNFKAKPIKK